MPTVQTKGRLKFIDPNDLPKQGCQFNDCTADNIPWAPEDLTYSVDLLVAVPNISDCQGDPVSIPVGIRTGQNFFHGTDLDKSSSAAAVGEANFLTNDYVTASYTEIRNGQTGSSESLGISSINITFDAHFFPQVEINFTDVRAQSLFAPAEENYYRQGSSNDNRKSYTSFYRALFNFPYPRFFLSVKGFYGTEVTFILAVSDFRSTFNSETGNFDVKVSFIGYMYGLYTDIPMNLAIIAPYIKSDGGEKNSYWQSQVTNGAFMSSDGTEELPTFIEFMDRYVSLPKTIDADALSNTGFYKQITDKHKTSESLNGALTAYERYIRAVKEWDSASGQQENNKYLLIGTLKSDASEILCDRTYYDEFKKEFDSLSDDIKNKCEGQYETNNQISLVDRGDISGEGKELLDKLSDNDRTYTKYALVKKGIINVLSDAIDTNDSVDIDEGTAQEGQSAILSEVKKNLKFTPTIENVFRMIFAHIDTLFHYLYADCLELVEQDRNNSSSDRTLKKLGINRDMTDLNQNWTEDSSLPPFTGFYNNKKSELVYPEEINDKVKSLKEVKFVDEILQSALNARKQFNGALEEMEEYRKAVEEANAKEESGDTTNTGDADNYIYLGYNDVEGDGHNPYRALGSNWTKDDVANLVLKRVLAFLSYSEAPYMLNSQAGSSDVNPEYSAKYLVKGYYENKVSQTLSSIAENEYNNFRSLYGDRASLANLQGIGKEEFVKKYDNASDIDAPSAGFDTIIFRYVDKERSIIEGDSNLLDRLLKLNNEETGQFIRLHKENPMGLGEPEEYGEICYPIASHYVATNKKGHIYVNTQGIGDEYYKIPLSKFSENSKDSIAGLMRANNIESSFLRYPILTFSPSGKSRKGDERDFFKANSADTGDAFSTLINSDYDNKSLVNAAKLMLFYRALIGPMSDEENGRKFAITGKGDTSVDEAAKSPMTGICPETFCVEMPNAYHNFEQLYLLLQGKDGLFKDKKKIDDVIKCIDNGEYGTTVGWIGRTIASKAPTTIESYLDADLLDFLNKCNDYNSFNKRQGDDNVYSTAVQKKLVELATMRRVSYCKQTVTPSSPHTHTWKELYAAILNKFSEEAGQVGVTNDSTEVASEPQIEIDDIRATKSQRRAFYYTLKNLSNKWLASYSKDVFKLDKPSERFKRQTRRYEEGTYDITQGNEFDSFIFVDSFLRDIGSDIYVNIEELYSLCERYFRGENASVYEFMAELAQKNKMLFLALPVFNNFYTDEAVANMFAPHTKYNITDYKTRGVGNTYVCMYTHEVSHVLEDESETMLGLVNDGIDVADTWGRLNALEQFNRNEESNKHNFGVPCFNVAYGKQNQNYFKSISVNMDSPSVTDYSIANLLQIAQLGANGGAVGGIGIGQDIYSIYSNRSYNCTVEMMGCANIMPMMYFQLNNIPMFKGAYMITNVEHKIAPGEFTTSFTGVRVSKRTLPFNDDLFNLTSMVDIINDAITYDSHNNNDGGSVNDGSGEVCRDLASPRSNGSINSKRSGLWGVNVTQSKADSAKSSGTNSKGDKAIYDPVTTSENTKKRS